MKAYLKNYRMSPRKVRLVGDAVKGKDIAKADVVLSFMPKKAARTIQTLIRSAVSNAVNNDGKQSELLIVKNIEVNQGVTLKRWRARARGSASAINKRTSNISVTLAEKVLKSTEEEKVATKATPKTSEPKAVGTVKKVAKKAPVKKVESKQNNPKTN